VKIRRASKSRVFRKVVLSRSKVCSGYKTNQPSQFQSSLSSPSRSKNRKKKSDKANQRTPKTFGKARKTHLKNQTEGCGVARNRKEKWQTNQALSQKENSPKSLLLASHTTSTRRKALSRFHPLRTWTQTANRNMKVSPPSKVRPKNKKNYSTRTSPTETICLLVKRFHLVAVSPWSKIRCSSTKGRCKGACTAITTRRCTIRCKKAFRYFLQKEILPKIPASSSSQAAQKPRNRPYLSSAYLRFPIMNRSKSECISYFI